MSAPVAADWRAVLREQLGPILSALAAGDDVAPARLHRAEGVAFALMRLGVADCEAIVECIRSRYAEVLGPERAAIFAPEDFRAEDRPAIPFRLPRAPVYPGSA